MLRRLAPALLLAACGDAADDHARDGGGGGGASADAAADADMLSDYGDGVCTEEEFRQGTEAIEISTSLALEGPAAVSAWVDMNQAKLDGIWADCVERFCPIAKQITDDCLANFATDEDAGPNAFGPSCYPLPPECEAILAEADAGGA